MQEYESDELASNFENEKKIRKAKLSPEKKKKESKASPGNASKKFKSASDVQLFRGKTFYLLCDVSRWVGLLEHPTIIPLVLYFYSI